MHRPSGGIFQMLWLCLVFSFTAASRVLVIIVRACYVPGALHVWSNFILSSEIHLSPYFIDAENKAQRP